MITEKYISGTEGNTYIEDAEIANVTILAVAKQGSILNEVTGTPTGREFKYTSTGRIDLGEALVREPVRVGPFDTYMNEKIYVIYKL